MAETRWLDDGEQQTWRTFLAAIQLLEGALDRQLRQDSGMPHAYYQVLVMLSEAPGCALTMTELAGLLKSSQSRLSHAVARLEEDGLVHRFKRPGDRRTTIAELTPRGLKVLRAAALGHVREVRRVLFDALSGDQVEQLRDISEVMLGKLTSPGEATRHPDPTGAQSQD